MTQNTLRSLFVLGVGIGLGSSVSMLIHVEPVQATPQAVPSFNPNHSLAPLVEPLSKAVVNVTVEAKPSNMPMHPFGWDFDMPTQTGQGSGFIISDDGYILTNHHVVDGASSLNVRLSNENEYTAELIGFDDSIDVALLKIDSEEPLPYLPMGDSDAVRVGDYAVAIGNPFGLSHTVTMGIISAKERVIGSGPYDNYLQTDASINPGNSGGPLFNLQGEVIGINTAINPKAQGIGFSLPINKVTSILEDLKEKGHPSRGWLGLSLEPSSEDAPTSVVREVYPNTPAAEGGLQAGDTITHFDGTPVTDVSSFVRLVGSYRAGDTVELEILRGRRSKTLSITLGERPSQQDLAMGRLPNNDTFQWGIQLSQTQGFSKDPTQQGWVLIQMDANSPLQETLQLGDILLSVNNDTNVQTALRELSTKTKDIEFRIWRAGSILTVQFSR